MPLSNIKQALDQRIIKGLTERINKIAKDAQDNASWSSRIPDAISVGRVEKGSNGYSGSLKVDLNIAPHAAAFEYGSGEHGERGSLYPIKAKDPEEQPLHFFGETWFIGPALPFGHPGVKARPYLQPAIDSNRDILREVLGRLVKLAYLDTTVKVEIISAKK